MQHLNMAQTDDSGAVRVGRFWASGPFVKPKQQLLLEQIHAFFTDDMLRATLMLFLEADQGGTGAVSKRDMDWLVTNYSKKYEVRYEWRTKAGWPAELVCVHDSYHCFLRQFRRGLFDIFCRGQRVYFCMADADTGELAQYETTVGQLHFLKWAHTYGVLAYLMRNYAAVAADHRRRQAQIREDKKRLCGQKRKRQELSPVQPQACTIVNAPVTLRWI